MKKKIKSKPSEREILIKRLRNITYVVCDPDCEGRCLDCPTNVVNAVIEYLEGPLPRDQK
jgi:hypothetical protein